MQIADQFQLPFSEGPPWILRFLKKYADKLPNSEALVVSAKLYRTLLKKGEEIQKLGLPQNLYLAHVNPQVNEGIFLKPNSDPIQEGSLIGIYTGLYELVESDISTGTAYAYDVAQGISLKKQERQHVSRPQSKDKKIDFAIQTNAKEKGNFTRYINHSSLQPNVEAVVSKLPNGRMEILLFCLKTIHPGEQLLSNYGGQYWKTLQIIPNDIRPSTYTLTTRNTIKSGTKPEDLSFLAQKILTPLRQGTSTFPLSLENKTIIKKMKKKAVSLTKKQKKEISFFEDIIAERGIPRKFKLTPFSKSFKISLQKKESQLPKNTLIGVFAGTFSCTPSKKSILIAKQTRSKLFLDPTLEGNFLSHLPLYEKKGNVALHLAWDKETEMPLLLAISTQIIQPGENLILEQFEPLVFEK